MSAAWPRLFTGRCICSGDEMEEDETGANVPHAGQAASAGQAVSLWSPQYRCSLPVACLKVSNVPWGAKRVMRVRRESSARLRLCGAGEGGRKADVECARDGSQSGVECYEAECGEMTMMRGCEAGCGTKSTHRLPGAVTQQRSRARARARCRACCVLRWDRASVVGRRRADPGRALVMPPPPPPHRTAPLRPRHLAC